MQMKWLYIKIVYDTREDVVSGQSVLKAQSIFQKPGWRKSVLSSCALNELDKKIHENCIMLAMSLFRGFDFKG